VPGYSDFVPAQRFEPTLALSASGGQVAYSSNASGQFNLYVQPTDGGQARQLTSFASRSVRQVVWSGEARLVFTADQSGDEQRQVYLVAADGSGLRQLTSGGQWTLAFRNPVSADGRYVLAAANDRDPEVRDLLLGDLDAGTWERYRTPEGIVAFAAGISPDRAMLLGGARDSNTACQCLIAWTADPEQLAVPVTKELPGTYFYPGPWAADGSFYACATPGRDYQALVRCWSGGELAEVIDAPDWDVEDGVAGSADGRTVAWLVNQNGRAVLRAQRDGAPLRVPELPAGVVRAMSLSVGGWRLALLLDTPERPGEILIADLAVETVRHLTDTRPAAVRQRAAAVPQAVTFGSADGTAIPGLMYRPAGAGRHPVLMHIHGGPTAQARPAYDALIQCLLARGIGVFAPNVRGSSGYGQAWQERIYRDWGGIDLQDFNAAARYLQDLDWVDPARMAVYGRSYGGFAVLSCLSRFPGLWAAGVSVSGPSDLITLARACPPSWRPNIDRILGNPDDDAEHLRQRSPLTYASQIKAPLLIIQGRQDPRVPEAASAQIAATLRANGTDARYQVYDDEGHTFTNRANELDAMTAIVDFLTEHLQPGSPEQPRGTLS
jgi:dipeptidyl aminopeptidase/acylaminoacyl peptidase